MECPVDIALNFLRKWQEEFTVLVIGVTSPWFIFTGDARVVSFDAESVHLSILTGLSSGEIVDTSADFVVSFRNVSFEYGDAREVPLEVREEADAMYETILSVVEGKETDNKAPSFILVLSELREQPKII